MTLAKETMNYEVLLRFNVSGKVGAHLQTITVVKDGGEVLSSALNPPQILTLNALKAMICDFTDAEWYAADAEVNQ